MFLHHIEDVTNHTACVGLFWLETMWLFAIAIAHSSSLKPLDDGFEDFICAYSKCIRFMLCAPFSDYYRDGVMLYL